MYFFPPLLLLLGNKMKLSVLSSCSPKCVVATQRKGAFDSVTRPFFFSSSSRPFFFPSPSLSLSPFPYLPCDRNNSSDTNTRTPIFRSCLPACQTTISNAAETRRDALKSDHMTVCFNVNKNPNHLVMMSAAAASHQANERARRRSKATKSGGERRVRI